MDKNSKSEVYKALSEAVQNGEIPPSVEKSFLGFYESYLHAEIPNQDITDLFLTFLELVKKECRDPYPFEYFHPQLRKPFDYHRFGIDFLRPLVKKEASTLSGKENLHEIEKHLRQGDNVVFFANHQIEADPQAISLLLEEEFPMLTEKLIFIAGERVTTDPVAIPFSLGCHLLCIYSKRYIDHPPEKKVEKQRHNKKTMERMSGLLKEGGKCIYVAPSGGRDRKNANGEIELAPFDPKSIEMFYLMGKKSKTPTFFYPMALGTYNLLPPPETVQVELGEERSLNKTAIHMSIGPVIDMQNFPGSESPDKHLRRKLRAEYIWNLVYTDYKNFPE